jgi:hypothetical protein
VTETALYLPSTLLRRTYEISRAQSLKDQIRECADHLSNPGLLAGELIDAFQAICSFDESDLSAICELEKEPVVDEAGELVLEHFHAQQQLHLHGAKDVKIRCLATNVRPVSEICPSPDGIKDGVDYIALAVEEDTKCIPMLGVAQSFDDTSAYALLLRGLACITELATDARTEILNQRWFSGALVGNPCFELHLILSVEGEQSPDEVVLTELSRDLAEMARGAMSSESTLSQRIGTVRCLRMDPTQFDGVLHEIWSI